jgi:CheY-like chemotaxis protein
MLVARVCLIHWNAAERKERAERLVAAGYEVDAQMPGGPALFRELAQNPPAAVLIDLSRLPSQGRDIAMAIRKRKGTRYLPLVLVGGDPDKVARIRALLPDAVYTFWGEIGSALPKAIARPPRDPVVPVSVFDGYAGKALPDKLGIKAHLVLALVDAPQGFDRTLGGLPEGVVIRENTDTASDLTIWFVRSRKGLGQGMSQMAARTDVGPLWIAWPKKASGVASDLSQQVVREAGLAAGLVDYKVCSIDETWSGLLFTRRKSKG